MSQASATSNPPVMATPLMAPMTGFVHISMAFTGLASAEAALAADMPPGSEPSSFRSRPAVKARSPAPVRMITRTSGSASTAFSPSCRARRRSRDRAFIASGRFRVRTAMPSCLAISSMGAS